MSATLSLREELTARRELPAPPARREIRLRAGVSLELIARELGVCRQAVGHWENGTRSPRGANLAAYVRVLRLLRVEAEAREGVDDAIAV